MTGINADREEQEDTKKYPYCVETIKWEEVLNEPRDGS
jgi:hypothetical protein